TADGLAGALGRVVGDEAYARAAEKAARHLAVEDGAARVVEAVRRLTRA
ncbi:MAG TPA: UDP-glucose--sterol glucosyltransferase, partial [Streptomyces sp.]|nr:UDP-glucose--sterol glucosyltransferase [Streptomyces sp.]